MRSLMLPCAAVLVLTAGATARADEFLQQEGDLWRASKLVGVNIYGPDNRKVGDVSDVLMGKDGKATYVVVGVGGFLGIGQKDVAIPFDKVTFTQEPLPLPPSAAPPGTAPGTMTAPGTPAAGTDAMNATPGLGTAAPANGTGVAPPPAVASAMTTQPPMPMPPRSTAYPDHGKVDYTADQLKAAPTFGYAK